MKGTRHLVLTGVLAFAACLLVLAPAHVHVDEHAAAECQVCVAGDVPVAGEQATLPFADVVARTSGTIVSIESLVSRPASSTQPRAPPHAKRLA